MLYKRFGATEAGIDPARQERMARDAEQAIERGTPDLVHELGILVSMNIGAATRYYLLGNHVKAKEYAERVLASARNYFFGDWRKRQKTDKGIIDPEWWHGRESWLHYFSGALCWGTVLGRWKEVRELARYPDDRRQVETLDATPASRRLLIDTARYLRGEKVQGVANACAKLEGVTWRGTDSLASALDAIILRDEERAQGALTEFFRRHHRRKKSKDVTDTVSFDGTTMFNLARQAKLNAELPAEVEHYYVRLPY
jgi:hypothetical protein